MKKYILTAFLLAVFSFSAHATTVSLLPLPKQEFRNQLGTSACSGCLLYTYSHGSSEPKTSYSDSTGLVANPNPVVADTAGRMSVWGNGCYKLVLKSSAGVTISTQDNICEYAQANPTVSQWQASGLIVTYVSGTTFSVPGDNTATFTAGTRLQSTNTSGTVYSTVVSSSYSSVTTVVVISDSGALDSGLSAVNIGIITASNSSLPIPSVTVKSSGYTITTADCGKTLLFNLTSAATATFPNANTVPSGCEIVTKVTGSTVTLAGTIDGMSNPTLVTNDQITVWSNGTSWYGRKQSQTAAANTIPVSGSNNKLAIGFDSNRPAYRATMNAQGGLSTGNFAKVAFSVETFDTNSNYDNVTNYRFTPTIAGKYKIFAQLLGQATTTITNVQISIHKNGSSYSATPGHNITSGTGLASYSDIVDMNGTTDYVEIFGVVVGTGTLTFPSNFIDSGFTYYSFVAGVRVAL